MRVCVSNLAWPPELDGQVAEVLIAAGAQGVELAPTKYFDDPSRVPDEAAGEVAAAWRERGLPIAGLQSLLFGRPEIQLFGEDGGTAFVAYLSGVFRTAQKLGAQRLVFGSPRNRRRENVPIKEAMEKACPVFARLGSAAEECGVRLCVEANPPEYGADFLNTTAQAAALLERVASPGIALQVDTACALLAGEPLPEALRSAGKLLAHFHASEPGLAPLGTSGSIDHLAAGDALREAGYTGWVSVETLAAPGDDAGSIIENLKLSLDVAMRSYG